VITGTGGTDTWCETVTGTERHGATSQPATVGGLAAGVTADADGIGVLAERLPAPPLEPHPPTAPAAMTAIAELTKTMTRVRPNITLSLLLRVPTLSRLRDHLSEQMVLAVRADWHETG
jgi:hypothetical protein